MSDRDRTFLIPLLSLEGHFNDKGVLVFERKPPIKSEEQLQTAILQLAKMAGWKVFHVRGDARKHIEGDRGFPDLVLARDGHVLIVELKSTIGEQTPEQREWQRHLRSKVWRPEDWEDIVRILTAR